MASTEQDTLLRALRDHHLPLGDDDVAWAFAGSETRDQAAQWVRQHLQPSTLLTRDEFELYVASATSPSFTTTQLTLCSSYERHGIATGAAVASCGRPLTDAEFEAAIDSLELGTAAIQRQCRILELQKQALHEIKARDVSVPSTKSTRDLPRRKKIAREKAQLDLQVQELSHIAKDRLDVASKQTDTANSNLPAQLDRLLQKDDRLLDGLQKLLPKVVSSPDEEESASVEQLCSALSAISIKEIRARLDRAYRETVADHGRRQNGTAASDLTGPQQKQRDTLRAELEELSGEIDGLVTIVVDHQYRKPLKQSRISALAESHAQKVKWSEYTISALAYLTERLDHVNEHAMRTQAHGSALRCVSANLEHITATTQHKEAVAPRTLSAAAVDQGTPRGLKPLRLVQANLSEGQDPAIQLLRQHEIRVLDPDNPSILPEILTNTLRDRDARISKLSKSLQQATADAYSQSLAKAEANAQHLLGAVYQYSVSGPVCLVENEVQSGLDNNERNTQRLGDDMRDLDMDKISRTLATNQGMVLQKLSRPN